MKNIPPTMRILILIAPFTALALALDRFIRDPMLASVGHRTAVGSPQIGIPFSGSLLLGLVFGLPIFAIGGGFVHSIRRSKSGYWLLLVESFFSRRPRLTRGFLGMITALFVMTLLFLHMIQMISPFFFLMGILVARELHGIIGHAKGWEHEKTTSTNLTDGRGNDGQ